MPTDKSKLNDLSSSSLSHNKVQNPLSWTSSARSHVGFVRSANEDSFLDAREQNLWVVADGMGGHSRGDQASQAIIRHLIDFEGSDDINENIENLEARLIDANHECRSMIKGKIIGSTVAALFVLEPFCFFLWVGDSRIYRLRGNTLEQMTEDHSLVQELCTLGELTPEEAEHHPSSNIITRAIGVHDKLRIEVQYATMEPGDRYLICSDGLYKDVHHSEIQELLANAISAHQSVNNLVNLALERGGKDNVTAIVAQAEFII